VQEHDIVPGAELSFSQKTSLARDLRPIKKESEKKLKAILSSDQMKEFKKIRKEALDEIKAQRKAE
jgi:very-short-patch-repair endonuclease